MKKKDSVLTISFEKETVILNDDIEYKKVVLYLTDPKTNVESVTINTENMMEDEIKKAEVYKKFIDDFFSNKQTIVAKLHEEDK